MAITLGTLQRFQREVEQEILSWDITITCPYPTTPVVAVPSSTTSTSSPPTTSLIMSSPSLNGNKGPMTIKKGVVGGKGSGGGSTPKQGPLLPTKGRASSVVSTATTATTGLVNQLSNQMSSNESPFKKKLQLPNQSRDTFASVSLYTMYYLPLLMANYHAELQSNANRSNGQLSIPVTLKSCVPAELDSTSLLLTFDVSGSNGTSMRIGDIISLRRPDDRAPIILSVVDDTKTEWANSSNNNRMVTNISSSTPSARPSSITTIRARVVITRVRKAYAALLAWSDEYSFPLVMSPIGTSITITREYIALRSLDRIALSCQVLDPVSSTHGFGICALTSDGKLVRRKTATSTKLPTTSVVVKKATTSKPSTTVVAKKATSTAKKASKKAGGASSSPSSSVASITMAEQANAEDALERLAASSSRPSGRSPSISPSPPLLIPSSIAPSFALSSKPRRSVTVPVSALSSLSSSSSSQTKRKRVSESPSLTPLSPSVSPSVVSVSLSPMVTASSSTNEQVSCTACTLLNSIALTKCALCGTSLANVMSSLSLSPSIQTDMPALEVVTTSGNAVKDVVDLTDDDDNDNNVPNTKRLRKTVEGVIDAIDERERLEEDNIDTHNQNNDNHFQYDNNSDSKRNGDHSLPVVATNSAIVAPFANGTTVANHNTDTDPTIGMSLIIDPPSLLGSVPLSSDATTDRVSTAVTASSTMVGGKDEELTNEEKQLLNESIGRLSTQQLILLIPIISADMSPSQRMSTDDHIDIDLDTLSISTLRNLQRETACLLQSNLDTSTPPSISLSSNPSSNARLATRTEACSSSSPSSPPSSTIMINSPSMSISSMLSPPLIPLSISGHHGLTDEDEDRMLAAMATGSWTQSSTTSLLPSSPPLSSSSVNKRVRSPLLSSIAVTVTGSPKNDSNNNNLAVNGREAKKRARSNNSEPLISSHANANANDQANISVVSSRDDTNTSTPIIHDSNDSNDNEHQSVLTSVLTVVSPSPPLQAHHHDDNHDTTSKRKRSCSPRPPSPLPSPSPISQSMSDEKKSLVPSPPFLPVSSPLSHAASSSPLPTSSIVELESKKEKKSPSMVTKPSSSSSSSSTSSHEVGNESKIDQLRRRALLYADRQWSTLLPTSVRSTLSSSLNESQLAAVKVATSLEGITLLQGPPGTGKTKTVVSLISALLLLAPPSSTTQSSLLLAAEGGIRPPRILVATPSNAALDELVSRIMAIGLINADGVVHAHTTQIYTPSPSPTPSSKRSSASSPLSWGGRVVRLGQPERVRGDVAESVSLDSLVDTFVQLHCKSTRCLSLCDHH
jgi:hypothetical protein